MRVITANKLRELISDALCRNMLDVMGMSFDLFERVFFDLESQRRTKANRPHHPKRIFAEALFRIPNCTDESPFDVLLASERIV